MFLYYFILSFMIFISVVSLILSILGFLGKDIILDNTYLKASKEEQERLNKKSYRIQGAIILLFLFFITLLNFLRTLLHISWLAYVIIAVLIIGIVYGIVSHYTLKKQK